MVTELPRREHHMLKNQGFTWLELLIVIALLAFVAAFVTPKTAY